MGLRVGDIVLAVYPFTDGSGNKKRPSVILASPERTGRDVILSPITSSVPSRIRRNSVLIPNTAGVREITGLRAQSCVVVDSIATLEKKLLLTKMGTLPKETMHEIQKKLMSLFDLPV